MDYPGRIGAVIPAAGRGTRFGGEERKQFLTIGDRPLLLITLEPFLASPLIAEIVVPVPGTALNRIRSLLEQVPASKPVRVIAGGKERQESVFKGVKALSADCQMVLIHDAVRPFVTTRLIAACIHGCRISEGAVTAIPVSDTVKEVEPGGHRIRRTLKRETIWLAQTPQVFRRGILTEALAAAEKNGISATDEAALVERLGYQVLVVEGDPGNIKITNRRDWLQVQARLADRHV